MHARRGVLSVLLPQGTRFRILFLLWKISSSSHFFLYIKSIIIPNNYNMGRYQMCHVVIHFVPQFQYHPYYPLYCTSFKL